MALFKTRVLSDRPELYKMYELEKAQGEMYEVPADASEDEDEDGDNESK